LVYADINAEPKSPGEAV